MHEGSVREGIHKEAPDNEVKGKKTPLMGGTVS